MLNWQHIGQLIRKDMVLEWRQRYAFYGVLLYVASTVFVLFMLLDKPEGVIWNALFWVVQLFVTVNTVAKSFVQEGPHRHAYYYTLTHPQNFIVAKLVYNVILMVLMSAVSLGVFMLMLGNPVLLPLRFVGVVMLGGVSLSLLFTVLAAVAAKAHNSASLLAILGFPLVIPMLMILTNLAKGAFIDVIQQELMKQVVIMGLLDVLVIGLGMILYPFLWKD